MRPYSETALLPSERKCCSLVPFAMWPAFPTANYYGTSATSVRHQMTLLLPAPHPPELGRLIDASHVHHAPLVGVVPSFAPAASPHAQTQFRVQPRRVHRLEARQVGAPSDGVLHALRRPRSTRFEPLMNRGVSTTGSLALHRTTLLVRPRRLVVTPSRYVVRAAPARHGNSRDELPSASPNRCGGQGWVS